MLPFEQQVISRHIVNPDTRLHHLTVNGHGEPAFDYEEICDHISFWKILLVEKYGARKGQTILIEYNLNSIYSNSAIFAAFELGLILIVDWPHAYNEEDVNSYKMTMHGKIDFAIMYSKQLDPTSKDFYQYWDARRNIVNCNQIITELDFDNYQIQGQDAYNTIGTRVFAEPNDTAIWSASSGTTGLPKKIEISHRKVYLQAERLARHLGFQTTDSSLHVKNIHHGASMCYHFLPTWMMAKEQYCLNHDRIDDLPKKIQAHKINKVLLYSTSMTLGYLKTTKPVDHDLDIITLFSPSREALELINQKNVRSLNIVFGDTTIGLGFFVKTVRNGDDPDAYEKHYVGKKLDDFFDLKVEDGALWIAIPELNEGWQTSNDSFELKGNKFYFYGRRNLYRIGDEWVQLGALDAETERLFGDRATIVVDQELESIYLGIWTENPDAEKELNDYFAQNFRAVSINKVLRGVDINEFISSRKVDRQRLRDVCRRL